MKSKDDTPWADLLQAGDKVTVVEGRTGSIAILAVLRTTAKQVVVMGCGGARRFWKRNLEEVGGGTAWHGAATICKTTQEHRNRIRRSNLIHAIHNRRDDTKVTLEMAERIFAILNEGGAIKKRVK